MFFLTNPIKLKIYLCKIRIVITETLIVSTMQALISAILRPQSDLLYLVHFIAGI